MTLSLVNMVVNPQCWLFECTHDVTTMNNIFVIYLNDVMLPLSWLLTGLPYSLSPTVCVWHCSICEHSLPCPHSHRAVCLPACPSIQSLLQTHWALIGTSLLRLSHSVLLRISHPQINSLLYSSVCVCCSGGCMCVWYHTASGEERFLLMLAVAQ